MWSWAGTTASRSRSRTWWSSRPSSRASEGPAGSFWWASASGSTGGERRERVSAIMQVETRSTWATHSGDWFQMTREAQLPHNVCLGQIIQIWPWRPCFTGNLWQIPVLFILMKQRVMFIGYKALKCRFVSLFVLLKLLISTYLVFKQ